MRSPKTPLPLLLAFVLETQRPKCIVGEFILGEISQTPTIGKGANENWSSKHPHCVSALLVDFYLYMKQIMLPYGMAPHPHVAPSLCFCIII